MLRILSVDDTPLNQRVIVAMLERTEAVVDCVESAADAIRRLDHAVYDLILMDLRMPEMDGFEAIRIIRRRSDRHAAIPIFVMTADAAPHLPDACRDAGGTGLLTKPFLANTLIELIASTVLADADI